MTTATAGQDWSPGTYQRFRGFRLRPALDLLAQVPDGLPPGAVVDLGCGAGAAGPALRARFGDRLLVGLDASPAMLAEAAAAACYDRLVEADIAGWQPEAAPALIFSNAALQWVPDHAALLPQLAALPAPGGVLAVQVPDQQDAPSHRLLREVAAALFPDRFDWAGWVPEVLPPAQVETLLAPFGPVSLWRTVYYQRVRPQAEAHPVRAFTESTAARRILSRLDAGEQARFLAAYDAALAGDYPPGADGSVLFPFARSFFLLVRGG